MNRAAVLIVVCSGSILASAALVHSQPAAVETPRRDTAKTIEATGRGVVTAAPDSARIHLAVVTSAPGVAAARDDNAKKISQVMTALGKLAIPGLKTRTVGVDVSYDSAQEGNPPGVPQPTLFSVMNSFTVLIHDEDPAKLQSAAIRVLDTALSNGVNSAGRMEFFREDDAALKRQAMQRAVQDALENARAYAAGAKVQIVDVTTIAGEEDAAEFDASSRQTALNPAPGASGTSLNTGELLITSRVRVLCRF